MIGRTSQKCEISKIYAFKTGLEKICAAKDSYKAANNSGQITLLVVNVISPSAYSLQVI